jgi:hypothetical protein
MTTIESYESALGPARTAFAQDPSVRLVQDAAIGETRLESFLITFNALGVAMTEPVEGWIRRAGQACVDVGGPGTTELGEALQKHAAGEADHHLMMISDLRALCDRRHRAGRSAPAPDDMLGLEWPQPVHRYRDLHEDVIAGDTPFAQIAIENEIELLSLGFGAGMLDNARALLHSDGSELSFLDEHVTLDVGHTAFNKRQMAGFLEERPDALEPLVRAGTAALDTYRAFVGHCLAASPE